MEVIVKIGVTLPMAQDDGAGGISPYADIRAVARAAEDAGLDSIWAYDHLLFREDGLDSGIHECWTVLAALAEATSRVQLGILVMCTAFRNPALLAKMAATLDHISGGRLILGLGCGWHDPEFEAFGYPTDHKVGRFEEALTVIRGLIREGRADLDGRWVQAHDAVLAPPARPELPILIAAKRPRMLELAARHADMWNEAWFGPPDERWAGLRRDLDAACRKVGRDPATLERSVGVSVRIADLLPGDGEAAAGADTADERALTGDADEIAAGIVAYAADGCSHLMASLTPSTAEAVDRFAVRIAPTAGGRRLA
jgi:alkanesulfonate monooxygenase SsuD/methylene tetrahydromethanopterin reductase-like flavin-dependent oxidoreductase (luciferase family)